LPALREPASPLTPAAFASYLAEIADWRLGTGGADFRAPVPSTSNHLAGLHVPHVVTDNCHLCRFTDCVETCPVACFHADEERTFIDPGVCIDCGACIPACPVRAIYEIIDLPDDQRRWIAINAERSRVLPVIDSKQEPLPTAAARRADLGY